jgi:hypothetical protein
LNVYSVSNGIVTQRKDNGSMEFLLQIKVCNFNLLMMQDKNTAVINSFNDETPGKI